MSFELPQQTAEVNVLGTIRLLEGVRRYQAESGRELRCFQSTSSEMFGKTRISPQTETTPFSPCTPYGCTKIFDFWQGVNYREAYGLFICNGILYNHESPRRGEMYVTRKITRAATRIKLGIQQRLYLGNLASRRDWGFSGDYVRAMWLMLQCDRPDDYILATGELHSLEEFLQEVFGYLDLDWHAYVESDPRLYRPAEVGRLFGDSRKDRELLDWTPEITFRRLAQMMTDHDLRLAESEL
jgi:GDPmannose 4,6-dehydratase